MHASTVGGASTIGGEGGIGSSSSSDLNSMYSISSSEGGEVSLSDDDSDDVD